MLDICATDETIDKKPQSRTFSFVSHEDGIQITSTNMYVYI